MFMDDVCQLSTLVLVLFVSAGFMAAYAIGKPLLESIILLTVAISIVLFIFPVVNAAQAKTGVAYEFYIASAIHPTLLKRGQSRMALT